ncbi:SDR family oxidoreductase [Hymenobacter psoromatis]|uniref:SDR family oxidoreductase n=1 Tax=Hymenobacter psoromatis TaxID=1484116 RepID=UPI001CC15F07|nr:SDR family oxidoreductase [Hymenobacter psoromatis]
MNYPPASTSDSAPDATPAILITGATGSIGTELTKLLAAQGVPFRAMVRHRHEPATQALAALPGATLAVGDFDQPETVMAALAGMERAFLLTNSSEQAEAQQLRFVQLAQQAGVRHLVKQSQWAATPGSPVRFLRYHAAVEAAIRATGLAYTFLRPNLFMQGLLSFRDAIAQQGKFFAPIGDAKISVVDVRDIAAAAAAALTQPGHARKTYDLTGPAALTHAEMAAQLSTALGHPVAFIDVSPDEMCAALRGMHLPAWQAEGLIEDYAHYHRGEAATVATGVQEATGWAPRNFADFARDYAPAFAGDPVPVAR